MVSAIECRLTCGHVFIAIAPIPNLMDKVWCSHCDMPRRVRVILEWRIKCNTCRYGKHCGGSKAVASRLATRHNQLTGHAVKIIFPGVPTVTVGNPIPTQSSFPNLLDTDPEQEESSH